jgi:hypothetical protein
MLSKKTPREFLGTDKELLREKGHLFFGINYALMEAHLTKA